VCDADEITGCDDINAINFDDDVTENDGSCMYSGCIDSCACNYDDTASVNDGSCNYSCGNGCIYATALNYDSNATIDDGSCLFQGCMNGDFSNYNVYANTQGINDCTNIPFSADLFPDGEVQLNDLLNLLQVFGLGGSEISMFDWAQNCYVEAIADDLLLATVFYCGENPDDNNDGCLYENALNYSENALIDHGTCLFPGCNDSEAFNFNPLANIDDGTCTYQACPDFNGDGIVALSDLLDLLLVWGLTY